MELLFNRIMKEKVANQNLNNDMTDTELEQGLQENRRSRQKFISVLEIPTYDNFRKVFFHDTLKCMAHEKAKSTKKSALDRDRDFNA